MCKALRRNLERTLSQSGACLCQRTCVRRGISDSVAISGRAVALPPQRNAQGQQCRLRMDKAKPKRKRSPPQTGLGAFFALHRHRQWRNACEMPRRNAQKQRHAQTQRALRGGATCRRNPQCVAMWRHTPQQQCQPRSNPRWQCEGSMRSRNVHAQPQRPDVGTMRASWACVG